MFETDPCVDEERAMASFDDVKIGVFAKPGLMYFPEFGLYIVGNEDHKRWGVDGDRMSPPT